MFIIVGKVCRAVDGVDDKTIFTVQSFGIIFFFFGNEIGFGNGFCDLGDQKILYSNAKALCDSMK
jgi:hypothetical protein